MSMPESEIISTLTERLPPCIKTLNGKLISFDTKAMQLIMEFAPSLDFCHSGNIVQGGFVSGMLDAAMAHSFFAYQLGTSGEFAALPTVELKVSFFRQTRPVSSTVKARIIKLGSKVVYTEAELIQDGKVTAKATASNLILNKVRPAG